MLPKLFSEDAYIALATQRLLDSVLQDELLRHEIQEIIKEHLQEKLRKLSNNQGESESAKIIQAAENVQSPITEKLTKYQRQTS